MPAVRFAATMLLLCGLGAPATAADVGVQVTQERSDGYRAEVVIRNPGEKRITDWSLEFSADRAIERAWGAEMSRSGDNRYRFRPDPWTREIAAGGQAKFTVAGPPGETPLAPAGVKLDAKYAAAADAPPPEAKEPAVAAAPKSPPPKPKTQPKSQPKADRSEKRSTPPAAAAKQTASRDTGAPATPVDHTLAFKLQSSWDSGFTAEVVVVNASERTLKPWRLEFDLPGEIVEMWNADFRKVGSGRYLVTPKPYNDQIDPNGFASFGFKTSTAFQARPEDSRLGAVN